MKKRNPCINCLKREPHCHAKCKEYNAFYKSNRKECMEKTRNRMLDEFKSDSIIRKAKAKHKQ